MLKEYIAYLKDNPQGYWFKNKLYGWGWTPAKWQGWAVIGVYLVIVLLIAFSLPKDPTTFQLTVFFVELILAIATLIGICYAKGEKPRWQWGAHKNNNKPE